MRRYHEKRRSGEGEVPSQYEFDFRTRDGQVRSVLCQVGMIPGTNRSVASVADITEQKRTARELQAAHQQTQLILNSMSELLLYQDTQHRILMANRAAAEAAGMEREELVGRRCYEVFQDTDRPCEDCPLDTVLETGERQRAQMQTEDGSYWQVRGYPVHDPDGTITGMVELARDITSRKKAEQQTKHHLRELQLISDTVLRASEMTDVHEICELVARKVQSVNEDAIVTVSVCERDRAAIRVRAVTGLGDAEKKVAHILGRKPDEITIYPEEMVQDTSPFKSGKLQEVPGGLYKLLAGNVPRDRCEQIERLLEIGNVYTIGFALDGKPYDGISIFLPEGQECKFASALETIASHVSALLQRKQAEHALRQSERRFRETLELLPDTVYEADADLCITYANRAAENMFGYSREVIDDGLQIRDVMPQDDFERAKTNLDWAAKTGETTIGEYRIQRQDGSVVHCEAHSAAVRDAEGELAGFRGILRDITERKEAEDRLRESEHLLRDIIESTADGILVVNEEGTVVYHNDRFVDMWGFDDELVRHATDHQLLEHAKQQLTDPEEFMRRVQSLYESDETGFDRLVFNDGRVFERYSSPLMRDGDISGRVWSFRDVSERERQRQQIQELSEFRQAVIDDANVWIDVVDDAGNIVVWNTAAEQISGYTSDDVVGDDDVWRRLYPSGEIYNQMKRHRRRVIDHGEELENFETQIQTRDGKRRTMSWNMRGLFDDDGAPIGSVAVGRDVTEHKRLEQQLRQAQKMEAVGELAGGVAHDFNNFLTIISARSEILSTHLQKNSNASEHLSHILAATEKAAGVTNQLQAFSGQQAGEEKVIDVNADVTEMNRMLRRLLGEDIEIIEHLHAELSTIEADPVQIQQMVMNLALNARDAMPNGGRLTIATANVEIGEQRLEEMSLDEAGQYLMLKVSDTGTGMDDETASRVFEPFFTTKSKGQGTGLGLSVVYGIVTGAGGTIDVESELDKDSVFRVYLPVIESEPAEPTDEPLQHEVVGGDETVLLAEDEPQVQQLGAFALESHGYEVMSADGGERALEIFQQHQEHIAIVVTDIVMPGMNGGELVDVIRESRPHLPVLYISGYLDRIDTSRLEQPRTDYLQKPFKSADMLRACRKLLDEEEDDEETE